MSTPTPKPGVINYVADPPSWSDVKTIFQPDNFGLSTDLQKNLGVTDSKFSFEGRNKNGEPEPRTCPAADDPPMKDVDKDVSDIIRSAGGDQQCVKDSDFYSQQSSGSMRAAVDSFLGSAEAEAKYQQSTMSNKQRQVGCGTFLLNASNIITKQKAMQCIINSCTQNTDVSATGGASVTIKTLALSPQEVETKAKLEENIIKQNTELEKSNTAALVAAQLGNASEEKLKILSDFMEKRASITTLSQKELLKNYNRDLNITDTTIKVSVNVSAFVKVTMTTEATNKLTALSESISKDVASMTVANELGTHAQDPAVKAIVSKNTSNSNTTSSSSITELAQKTKVSAVGDGSILIEAPGIITLTNTVIDANVAVSVIVQQLMGQAVSNGLDIATKTLNDNKSVSDVLNKVRGLDDFQKQLNEAIKAGTDAPPGFGDKPTSMLTYVLIGVAVLVGIVVLMKMTSKGGNNQPFIMPTLPTLPALRFRSLADISHKMKYKMGGDNRLSFLIGGIGIIPVLIVLYFALRKR